MVTQIRCSGCFCSQITQCSNCQIRNRRISAASVTPMLAIEAKGHVGPPKSGRCHLFHLFYQVHIRLGSPHSAPRCFRYLRPNNSHRSSSPNRPAQPIGASRSSMRREHCGNFSVAYIVMSGEALRPAGVTPPRRGVARCFHARGETLVSATLSSFMHEQRKCPKERYSKSVDSTSSHNSADFKVSHYPHLHLRVPYGAEGAAGERDANRQILARQASPSG